MSESFNQKPIFSRVNQNDKPQERLIAFDILKLVAMSYVLFGHVLQRWYVVNFTQTVGFSFFYSVSLAIFFFVGGFFVKKATKITDLLLYLAKLFISYIVPAFLFTCLSIWLLPRFADHDFAYWMGELYYRTDTFYWFFLTAFFINTILGIGYYLTNLFFKESSLIDDLLKTMFLVVFLVIFSSVFIYIYNANDLGPGTLSANMFLYYLPIAFLGFLLATFKKYFASLKKIKFLRITAFAISSSIYIVGLWHYQNWLGGLNSSFNEIAWRMIIACAGVISYYYIALFVERFTIIQKVAKYAKYSGPFYLVHVFLIRLLATYLPRPEVFNNGTMLFIVFLTVGFYIGSLGITMLMVDFPFTNLLFFGDYKSIKKIRRLFQKSADNLN